MPHESAIQNFKDCDTERKSQFFIHSFHVVYTQKGFLFIVGIVVIMRVFCHELYLAKQMHFS